jgi:Fur family ferric uptake transcriptional regulator
MPVLTQSSTSKVLRRKLSRHTFADKIPERVEANSNVVSRNTKQKEAIRTAFGDEGRPLSPEETLEFAQLLVEGLNIGTVYRNIRSLVQEKWLTPIHLPGESARYIVAGRAQHHHFRCNDCGRVFEMPSSWAIAKPRLPRGFRATGHEFFIYGVCATCR